MKTRSILRQTILTILLTELICAIAFTSTALLHERRIRLRALDVTLQGRSDSVLGAIQDAEDPETDVTIDPHELNIPKKDIYAVYNRGSRLLGSSKNAPSELIQRKSDGFSTRVLNGQSYRVLQREGLRVIDRAEHGVDGLQRPVTILYAMRSDHIWHEVLEAASFYVGLSVLLIFGTALFIVVLLRRALRPLKELATVASTVSVRTLDFVPPNSALQVRELQPLAITLSTTVRGLREAFESQRRFLGDAAHELKTAVAVVRSSVQLMMLRPRTTSEYAQGLETVLNDNMRVEDLVSRMLSLARMEEQYNRVLSPIDVAIPVQKAILDLKSFVEMHNVNLKEHVEAPMFVRMAAEDVHVLVANLVVNAVQHSFSGAMVELTLERQAKSAILCVRDYGTGISTEALPHVFERFYREDRSRSRETGGAGLGLSICKLIVERADGTIAIESKLGVGANITVTLPCV